MLFWKTRFKAISALKSCYRLRTDDALPSDVLIQTALSVCDITVI